MAFTVRKRLGIHNYRIFGVLSRGPFARCVRFAAAVADVHATLATELMARHYSGGTCTRWVASSSFRLCLHGTRPFPQSKLCLAHSEFPYSDEGFGLRGLRASGFRGLRRDEGFGLRGLRASRLRGLRGLRASGFGLSPVRLGHVVRAITLSLDNVARLA